MSEPLWTRRRALAVGVGAAAAAVVAGVELVDHNVLPGKHYLEEIDGACDVATPSERFARPGPTFTGRFFSRARHREASYTLAYPPGHGRGSRLPLALCLHGDGGDHASGYGGLPLAHAIAGIGLPPIALVQADGGNLYWHPHPGDDPMAMMIEEVRPMCQRLGLGAAPGSVAVTGTSMGGYGAIVFAETHPEMFAACAAISPAIWTTYTEAHGANPGAYTNAREFDAYDAVTHTAALARVPVRVASGNDDPFHLGVEALIPRLPKDAVTDLTGGCHDGSFFASQREASLRFLGAHVNRD
jgi:pimeloyl-ACP methyl ester carboxylesterase